MKGKKTKDKKKDTATSIMQDREDEEEVEEQEEEGDADNETPDDVDSDASSVDDEEFDKILGNSWSIFSLSFAIDVFFLLNNHLTEYILFLIMIHKANWNHQEAIIYIFLKDVPQLCLCVTWPRWPAGYNNNITILHIKAVPEPPSCAEL